MATRVGTSERTPDPPRKIRSEEGHVMPGTLFHGSSPKVIDRQHFTPESCHLRYSTCGEFELSPAATSREFGLPGGESLLFMGNGSRNR